MPLRVGSRRTEREENARVNESGNAEIDREIRKAGKGQKTRLKITWEKNENKNSDNGLISLFFCLFNRYGNELILFSLHDAVGF